MRPIDFDYNDQLPAEDKSLFSKMRDKYASDNEMVFFETMIRKEIYEYPVSTFDVIMHQDDNEDNIFIDKCYCSEYRIGKTGEGGATTVLPDYPQSLARLLSDDLFGLVGEHISVLEWLRRRDYRGIRYDYPWEE